MNRKKPPVITIALFIALIINTLQLISVYQNNYVVPKSNTQITDVQETDSPELSCPVNDWEDWDNTKRTEWLQQLADKEMEHLGLEHTNVVCRELNKNVAGNYKTSNHLISIDSDYLSKASVTKAMRVILHECYHCYSQKLIDLYNITPEEYHSLAFFDEVKVYKEEFSHYENVEDDSEEYARQQVERDAKEYAESRVSEIYYSLLPEEVFEGPVSIP